MSRVCRMASAERRAFARRSRSSECSTADVSTAFDGAGWVGCPADTYMNGLYKSDGNALWNIETMNCCGDPGATLTNCEDHDISVSFDIAGTVECPGTKVMTGMYRSGGL